MYKQPQQSRTKNVVVACLLGAVAVSSLGYIASNMNETSNISEEMMNLRGSRSSHSAGSSNSRSSSKLTKMEKISSSFVKDQQLASATLKKINQAEEDIKGFADEDFDFNAHIAPAAMETLHSLGQNVAWGDVTTEMLVNVDDIKRAFDNSDVIAQTAKMFPSSYKVLVKLNQDMKILKFDLSTTVQDVELMARSTEENLKRAMRKVDLRLKYTKAGKALPPSTDAKIWGYVLRSAKSDLSMQHKQTSAILKVLKKIETESLSKKSQLLQELGSIKRHLENKMPRLGGEIKTIEQEISKTKCGFWDSLLTFGNSCIKAQSARNAMRQVQLKYKMELKVASELYKKLEFFNAFTHPSPQEKERVNNAPVPEAETPVPDVSHFPTRETGWGEKPKKEDNPFDPLANWNPSATVSNPWTFLSSHTVKLGGDSEPLIEFTSTWNNSAHKLMKFCEKVQATNAARKAALTKALIWGN